MFLFRSHSFYDVAASHMQASFQRGSLGTLVYPKSLPCADMASSFIKLGPFTEGFCPLGWVILMLLGKLFLWKKTVRDRSCLVVLYCVPSPTAGRESTPRTGTLVAILHSHTNSALFLSSTFRCSGPTSLIDRSIVNLLPKLHA